MRLQRRTTNLNIGGGSSTHSISDAGRTKRRGAKLQRGTGRSAGSPSTGAINPRKSGGREGQVESRPGELQREGIPLEMGDSARRAILSVGVRRSGSGSAGSQH